MTAALRSDQVDQWTACSYVLTCAACQIGNERRLWLFDMLYFQQARTMYRYAC